MENWYPGMEREHVVADDGTVGPEERDGSSRIEKINEADRRYDARAAEAASLWNSAARAAEVRDFLAAKAAREANEQSLDARVAAVAYAAGVPVGPVRIDYYCDFAIVRSGGTTRRIDLASL